MIRFVIGVILFTLSTINHSSLYAEQNSNILDIHKFVRYSIASVILIVIQGVLGLCIVLIKLNPVYHTIICFSIILILLIMLNLELIITFYKNNCLSLRREGFEAVIYSIVITLLLYHVHSIMFKGVMIIIVSALTVIMLSATIFLWKYLKDLSKLVDTVNIGESMKIFTFASMLFGITGILSDLYKNMSCSVLIASIFTVLVAYVYVLKEVYVKYLKPLEGIKR